MKKLLLDSCTKTAFSYNILYHQCDGVSMGSSLAPVLASIILTEFEKIVVTPRYVDDTLVLVMEDQIDKILRRSSHSTIIYDLL